jgi:hypothetical protein
MSSFVTRRSVDRRNRVIFFILGLILLALGIAGLLIQAEILTRYADIESPGYYYRVIRELAQDYPGWAIAAFIVLGLLLFLIGLSWIRGQMATPSARVREVTLQNEPQGTTVVDADVISNAVARDLERMPDVHDASARLTCPSCAARWSRHTDACGRSSAAKPSRPTSTSSPSPPAAPASADDRP